MKSELKIQFNQNIRIDFCLKSSTVSTERVIIKRINPIIVFKPYLSDVRLIIKYCETRGCLS